MKKNRIKTVEEFEKYLFANFNASLSSVDEVNTYKHYSLEGDNEHDYTRLVKVYKVLGEHHPANPYEEIFILIFSKNGGIFETKCLGMDTDKLEKMWLLVDWED